MTLSTRHAVAALGLAAALALGACGGGNGGDGSEGTEQGHIARDAAATISPLRIEADEFSLSPEPLQAAPGTVAFEYVNIGAIEHTLVIDGVEGLRLEVPHQGDVDTGAVELKPGTYTVFCDIPGHRPAGMEAPLTVE